MGWFSKTADESADREVEGMWRERNMHQRRAERAEDAGFFGRAREHRELAEQVEERIEAAEQPSSFWSW
jgi:hypothetical protein